MTWKLSQVNDISRILKNKQTEVLHKDNKGE